MGVKAQKAATDLQTIGCVRVTPRFLISFTAMSKTLKTIFKWVGYLLLALAGGAAGGAGTTML